MSEPPKMQPEHVKKHLSNPSAWPLAGWFWQQNSLGYRRSWLTTWLLSLARTVGGNQVCDHRIGHGENTDPIRPSSNTTSTSCRRQSLQQQGLSSRTTAKRNKSGHPATYRSATAPQRSSAGAGQGALSSPQSM